MNLENWKQIENLLPQTYFRQAVDAIRSRENKIQQLIQHKKIPEEGWDEQNINIFLQQLSLMDSNNFPENCGVGEREARFASEIVARRHFYFGHGVGRSGDLNEIQPKAAGSSLISKLTNYMLNDLMQLMGVENKVHCILVPMATGMSLVLTMLTLRLERPEAKYVIWSRIDQKSCFKSIITTGFKPIIIEPLISNGQLITDTEEIRKSIKNLEPKNILCVMTTTSCFAPRACDSIETIGEICKEYSVPHLINNAYGLQSQYYMKRIQKAHRVGRVDVFVQSTDKNLMVPVGGAIVASFNKQMIDKLSQMYPGRATSTPTLDVFITLLNIGKNGYISLIKEREEMYKYLKENLIETAKKHNETVIITPENHISLAMTLKNLKEENRTKLGSTLFIKCVSGARVVIPEEVKTIADYTFTGWSSHCKNYFTPYLTCAASIGMTKNDVNLFIKRLDKALTKIS